MIPCETSDNWYGYFAGLPKEHAGQAGGGLDTGEERDGADAYGDGENGAPCGDYPQGNEK